ncbi:hypothetical protein WICPIJ_006705 [Wickerhamomyces pijperi]|uniref:Uncharacterized protein n=1 Tax=Wickerhamomyces pijperi TaxID=599730 RepID=A0A9P8Q182_WICPI|nr:hypothetical protein WICPIJ_006705 [Wickerhamomyces pijperi]
MLDDEDFLRPLTGVASRSLTSGLNLETTDGNPVFIGVEVCGVLLIGESLEPRLKGFLPMLSESLANLELMVRDKIRGPSGVTDSGAPLVKESKDFLPILKGLTGETSSALPLKVVVSVELIGEEGRSESSLRSFNSEMNSKTLNYLAVVIAWEMAALINSALAFSGESAAILEEILTISETFENNSSTSTPCDLFDWFRSSKNFCTIERSAETKLVGMTPFDETRDFILLSEILSNVNKSSIFLNFNSSNLDFHSTTSLFKESIEASSEADFSFLTSIKASSFLFCALMELDKLSDFSCISLSIA